MTYNFQLDYEINVKRFVVLCWKNKRASKMLPTRKMYAIQKISFQQLRPND